MSFERQGAYEAARGRWPHVALSFDAFCRHLDSLGLESLPPQTEALFLCAACLAGDAAAYRELDREFLSRARGAIARINANPEFVNETLQTVRQDLLMPPEPKLAKYTGRGSLEGWLRIVAGREALDQVRRDQGARRRSAHVIRDMAVLLPDAARPESELARREHTPAVRQALAEALAALPIRDRSLLRLHFAQGLGIDVLGRMYGVHRATAARWLVRIRQRVLSRVKANLQQRLGNIPDGDLASLVRALRSDMSASLSGLLGPAAPPGSGDEAASSSSDDASR